MYRVLQAWKDLQAWEKLPAWKRLSSWKDLPAWKEWEETSFPIEIYSLKGENLIYLGKIADASQMPNLDFLENIDIDILNPAKNPGGKANQKWHLYVGVFVYSVVCQNYSKYKVQFSRMKEFKWDNDFRKWPCLVLRLWMIENAEGQEAVLKEIEEVIEKTDVEEKINNAFIKIMEGQA